MGGNGSYGKALGGVAKKDRTHYDTGYRIDADGRVRRPSGSYSPATQGQVLRPKVPRC